MANYANIKATIDANIKQNGNEEITGPVLNSVINQLVETIIAGGYLYGGFATPLTAPGAPDANTVWLAQGPGTFTDFGGLELGDGLYALTYDGSWTATPAIDWAKVKYELTELDQTLFAQNAENFTINATTNTWTSSSTNPMYFMPLVPGRTYRVQAQDTVQARFAILRLFPRTPGSGSSVKYATGITTVRIAPPGTYIDITAPANGYFMAINSKRSGVASVPTVYALTVPGEEPVHPLAQVPVYAEGRRIDCRTSETTFGLIGAATNTSWGCSQAFPVRNARKVRFFTSIGSTSANYANYTGGCFYDKNFKPITYGVWITRYNSVAVTGWVDVDVPEGAEYFVHEMTLGSSQTKNPTEIHYLDDTDILPAAGSMACPYVYGGERISLRENKFGWSIWGMGGISAQSAARSGKYLFIVREYVDQVLLYDLETRAAVYTLTTGITPGSHWHANQCCFGGARYDASDLFPLLYISQQNNADGRGEVDVFRIVPTLTDGEVTSFTMTQVQTILLPVMTADNALGNPNFAYDPDSNCFWCYSRNNNAGDANAGLARFTRFAVPDISQASVTLEDSDIVDAFSDTWRMTYAQGGFIHGGKLYIGQGYPNVNHVYFRVVDLYGARKQVSFVDLYSKGFNFEPEGVFEYGGEIIMTTTTQYLMRLIV